MTEPYDMKNMEIVTELEKTFDHRTVELIRELINRVASSMWEAKRWAEGKETRQ